MKFRTIERQKIIITANGTRSVDFDIAAKENGFAVSVYRVARECGSATELFHVKTLRQALTKCEVLFAPKRGVEVWDWPPAAKAC